ncbi:MAG: DUF2971 domain-containing protein [Nitrospirota bacterium]|nr:DUF2971 domain-containing protein [Nitrospirota bacterium]
MYFSSPSRFNDPFDCRTHLTTGEGPEEDKKANDALREVVNAIGVCCFSARNDDIVSWAHYGGGHSGVCLLFTLQVEEKVDLNATKRTTIRMPKTNGISNISYAIEMPNTKISVNPKENNEVANNVLFTKAISWESEKEWRWIKNAHGHLRVDPRLLTRIYVGCNMKDEDIELIDGWVRERDHGVELFRAVKKEKEYGLDFERIS